MSGSTANRLVPVRNSAPQTDVYVGKLNSPSGPRIMSEIHIDKMISQLRRAKAAGQFSPFIDFIQFPKYRCLSPSVRIDFTFPVTVLVGQNGTGKTSVLQALYGAPKGKSVSKHWFGTAVDPIDSDSAEDELSHKSDLETSDAAVTTETDRATVGKQKFQGERSAFWYGYHQKNVDGVSVPLEAVKVRIRREENPDYWEPSRPLQNYGMQLLAKKARSPQIEMSVTYLSLRFNLNAFDRCFHFASESTLRTFRRKIWEKRKRTRRGTIQDYMRHRSRDLKTAIMRGGIIQHGKTVMNTPPRSLTAEELKWVGAIIGKNYTSGAVVDHRFYETPGRSVLLNTASHSYSEAFAGSGESLVGYRFAPSTAELVDLTR
jgi:hypothetical protein